MHTRLAMRLSGALLALPLLALLGVPPVLAATPSGGAGRVEIVNGGNVDIPAGDQADVVIVTGGAATVAGSVRFLLVVDGTASLRGGHADDIVAVGSSVSIDAASTVSGSIQSFEATIDAAPGTVQGAIVDLAPALASFVLVSGAFGILMYLGWMAVTLLAGLAVAGLAARQVREVGSIIAREPLLTAATAIGAGIVMTLASALALFSIAGIPFGLTLLLIVLPAMLMVGYLVAAIGLGEAILWRTSGVTRERPYLASVVGLLILGLLGIVPVVSLVAAAAGFGAIIVRMWRGFRAGTASAAAAGRSAPATWPAA